MRDKSHDDDISRYVAATFMTRARKTRLTQLRTIGRNVIFFRQPRGYFIIRCRWLFIKLSYTKNKIRLKMSSTVSSKPRTLAGVIGLAASIKLALRRGEWTYRNELNSKRAKATSQSTLYDRVRPGSCCDSFHLCRRYIQFIHCVLKKHRHVFDIKLNFWHTYY